MKLSDKEYKEMYIRSNELEIPRRAYQRSLNVARVRQIAKHFDERIANEPKVSLRNGHYYVFDGQHTAVSHLRFSARFTWDLAKAMRQHSSRNRTDFLQT